MIVLLSPAKTLDFSPSNLGTHSIPRLLPESDKLVKTLRKKSVEGIKDLMHVSDKIANLNVARFKSFSTPFSLENAKQLSLIHISEPTRPY